MKCRSVAAVMVLLAVALTGCTDGDRELNEARSLPPGTFFEANLRMEPGDRVEWQWNATGDLRFDMHTHFDGGVQYHRQWTGTSGGGGFQAERAGIHSLLWENPGHVVVRLEFTVAGDFVLDSFHPE